MATPAHPEAPYRGAAAPCPHPARRRVPAAARALPPAGRRPCDHPRGPLSDRTPRVPRVPTSTGAAGPRHRAAACAAARTRLPKES
ncbi:hypothetical protein POF50_023215 [Streptomyces sp. SL13]|uniref:Uncharacterized protein n=1 Tax=Streptantibioticus silvisoli TaxID=2705255 RepID=A0AA90KI46_9ACTN|nr:hypothetical protein [Streptantibioticus silvisoli]MDI5972209.1 hypothetical protein [Streptantibioticus silvisoli]